MDSLLFLSLIASLFGLCIGSFLNVVIYRLPALLDYQWNVAAREQLQLKPKKEKTPPFNLARPRSHCPHCKKTIPIWLNLPLIGFLLSRGRCHECQHSISPIYPLVELLGGLSAGFILYFFGVTWLALGLLLFTYLIIPLIFIDIQHQLLPDIITLPALWLGLFFNLFDVFSSLQSAVIGVIVGYLSLWLIGQLFKKIRKIDGIGYGDFKLFAMCGAWLGWQALPFLLLLASLVGLIIGASLMLYKKQGRETSLPFGPYLAIAGWIFLVWKTPLLNAIAHYV